MKKKEVAALLLVLSFILLLSPLAFSESVDSEIQKITHYAEEFETGNINYVQLLVYTSAVRQSLNQILGATGKEQGGLLKQEQLKPILGEPTETRKWVWVEKEEKEKKVDYDVPIWEKIIFDGKKIQINLAAWPSLFEKKGEESKGEESLVYRLNFMINFKKPEEQLDIQSKITSIKSLAETFNADPSFSNAETLAKESVNVERTFESYYRQNPGKCEDVMISIFGSENQRQAQKLIVHEIYFYQGENYEVIVRLEFCDDCEYNWVNLDMRMEGRGPGFRNQEENSGDSQYDSFKSLDASLLKEEIKNILNEIKQCFETGGSSECLSKKQKLNALNMAWNDKSNNIWQEIDKEYQEKMNALSEAERQKLNENYGWIKQEQEKQRRVKELVKQNYEERKQFYLDFFSSYEKKEYYYTQAEWEKRLIEEFREFGKEICDNNQDDNKDNKIDCADQQCGGKICGKTTSTITKENQTTEQTISLYCIAGECKAREEIVEEEITVCGNHICEENETIESCAEDCALCQEYSAVNCSGKVIFKGKDENGCPLEPVCIEEETCTVDEDCKSLCGESKCIDGKCQVQELKECKEAECVDGDKKVKNCDSGEEIVVEFCEEGLWVKTGVECPTSGENKTEDRNCNDYCSNQPHPTCEGNFEISGIYPDCTCNWLCKSEGPKKVECFTREDCGGENDVCSNEKCTTIPEIILVEPEVEEETETEQETTQEQTPSSSETSSEPASESTQETTQEQTPSSSETSSEPASESAQEQTSSSEQTPATGGVIFAFFKTLLSKTKITGAAITGLQTEGETDSSSESDSASSSDSSTSGTSEGELSETQPGSGSPTAEPTPSEQQPMPTECAGGCGGPSCPPCEGTSGGESSSSQNWEEENRREEENKRAEDERRAEEQRARCKTECTRPCVEKCIKDNCGEKMECNIDEESKKCEGSCEADSTCVEKCMGGGDWWQEFDNKEEYKQEKGVFQMGGNCRTSQSKTEAFIYFGGWGEPFDKIQNLKQKYYSGGQADWCKYDLENLKKQRQEFEKSFNQEFASWFFEKYLSNSAENWEQTVSGIFEVYWKDVENSREMAYRMNCLGITELSEYTLINVNYSTEYGSLEFWEEVQTIKLPEMDKEVQIISPYMKAWIFPPIDFIKYEMKNAMKNHEFPGSPEDSMERKNEDGPTAEEKEMIKQDKKFMAKIKSLSQEYDGNLDVVIQFKDNTTDEVLFNIYVQINENDIITMKPMLPEEVPAQDVKVEVPFNKIYELISTQEKEMTGERIESPPWGQKRKPVQRIKEVVNGVKMYFKVRGIMNSATFTPEESEDEIKSLAQSFFFMMKDSGESNNPEDKELADNSEEDKRAEEGVWESKEVITGEVIR